MVEWHGILSGGRALGRLLGCLALLVSRLSSLEAQLSPPQYRPATLSSTSFLEVIATSVVSRSGGAEVRRSISRSARYGVRRAADTVIVSADSLDLSESSGDATRRLDAGGFLGGQWKLFLDARGAVRVLTRPFVPDAMAEVSDVGAAMDDFFPRLPMALAVGGSATDSAGMHWSRLADSSGLSRYQWSVTRQHAGTRTVADTVPLRANETTRESGTLGWDPVGVPRAWTRVIHTELTSTIRGRTVQGVIDQRIMVRRVE